MGFGYNADLSGYRRLSNFDEALKFYESCRPWRGETEYGRLRPVDKTNRDRNRQVSVDTHDDGKRSVRIRLYSTDVVEFFEDGRIEVDPSYTSVTTGSVINSVVDHLAPVHINRKAGEVIIEDLTRHRMYWVRSGRSVTLLPQGDGKYIVNDTDTQPFKRERIIRKEAKRLCAEYNVEAFAEFARAYGATLPPISGKRYVYNICNEHGRSGGKEVLHARLNGTTADWVAVLEMSNARCLADAERVICNVREAIYKWHSAEVYETITEPFIEYDLKQYRTRWTALQRAQKWIRESYK